MTRRRWIADESDGDRAALTGDNAKHLARVLRAKPGEQFDVSAGGRVRSATITSVSEQRVEFDLGDDVAPARPERPVTLVLAVFKFDRMEWAIEKATELGVEAIIPVIAERTDVHLATAAKKRVERWRKIALEAAQQSRRATPPSIAEPVRLKQWIDGPRGDAGLIVFSEFEDSATLAPVVAGDRPLFLAVGPEGGWTPQELQAFAQHQWSAVSLGPTILRAETAAIAGLAAVRALSRKSQ